ncbi:hypothetical protein F5876DRAFT_65597 [Lentinula aff. lateritia]|uniref:Uncharacterized protein n=1 Tax=Lentinula aff. lateritia TaxID=2804960 RepID=A0ACC1U0C7_9AGAR|nr:hypothetical protein F5876DRAFT_65597 [Lentinula aff. lateritia]
MICSSLSRPFTTRVLLLEVTFTTAPDNISSATHRLLSAAVNSSVSAPTSSLLAQATLQEHIKSGLLLPMFSNAALHPYPVQVPPMSSSLSMMPVYAVPITAATTATTPQPIQSIMNQKEHSTGFHKHWSGWPDGDVEFDVDWATFFASKELGVHWSYRSRGFKGGSIAASNWPEGLTRQSVNVKVSLLVILLRSQIEVVQVARWSSLYVAAHEIAQPLINPDRVAKEAHIVQNVLRGQHGASSEASDFFQKLRDFRAEHPDFILCAQVDPIGIISVASPWMRARFSELSQFTDDAVNRIVSDATHGFWKKRTDLLIISSVYNERLRCWTPGIFYYVDGATSEHYRRHFLAVNQIVVET